MDVAKNLRSWGEGKPLLKAATGAMTDASAEAWWTAERLSDNKVLVRGRGKLSLTLYYARPVRGRRRTILVVDAEAE